MATREEHSLFLTHRLRVGEVRRVHGGDDDDDGGGGHGGHGHQHPVRVAGQQTGIAEEGYGENRKGEAGLV